MRILAVEWGRLESAAVYACRLVVLEYRFGNIQNMRRQNVPSLAIGALWLSVAI